MNLNQYFDKIYCINLERRPDKWVQCMEQFDRFGIVAERFDGHEPTKDLSSGEIYGGGNSGCTNSHRGVLELIAHHRFERALVLEDDFQIVYDDFQERFDYIVDQVPNDWDMLFLGGHYPAKPKKRVAPNVIRFNTMLTTSSYGVTWKMAKKMAPHIFGVGPIDNLYHAFQTTHNCYIFSPRLIVQRPSFSDIQGREMDNSQCMLDPRHEEMV